MGPTCPGLCCAVLHLPGSIGELRGAQDILLDGPMILDMIEPIGREEALERRRRHAASVGDLEQADDGRLYTCRHWDTVTHRCSIYRHRPAMCRDYPYNEPCRHCGLTMGITRDDRVELERSKRKARRAAINVSP